MKSVVFTKHALQRIDQRSGFMKYAEKVFRKAELLYKAKNIDYYRNGSFRFVVRETPSELLIITVIKDGG